METGFEVFGEAAIATEPSQGALDDPASGQDDKACRRIAALDDLEWFQSTSCAPVLLDNQTDAQAAEIT